MRQQVVDPDIDAGRGEWEAAVEPLNRALDVAVASVDCHGVPAEWIGSLEQDRAPVILHLHGGGYTAGSPRTHRQLAARLNGVTGWPVLLPDYRLAPEHPCPAAINDAVAVYRWLLTTGIDGSQIALGGDSAGGGLALATVTALRDAGDPLPAAIYLMSPWLDITHSGDSMRTHAPIDPTTTETALRSAARLYRGSIDVRDPRASPLFADLTGLPPILAQACDLEILQCDTIRLGELVRDAGGAAAVELWPGMSHVWHASDVPEAYSAIERIAAFLKEHVVMSRRQAALG